jgi:L-ascorbate metabolism protein UlaG (beta-lactamase superfamily)
LLDEHRVDLAIVNVGSYDAVREQPEAILLALQPRYVLAAHWENFFAPLDPPVDPIPFHASVTDFDDRALATLGEDERQPSLLVDGRPAPIRYLRPQPGVEILVPAP